MLYETKNGQQTGFVPGVGAIVNGLIEVPDGMIVENHNLVKVEQDPQAEQISAQPPIQTPVQPPVSAAPAAPVASNQPQQSVPQTDPQTPKQETVPINPVNNEETNR